MRQKAQTETKRLKRFETRMNVKEKNSLPARQKPPNPSFEWPSQALASGHEQAKSQQVLGSCQKSSGTSSGRFIRGTGLSLAASVPSGNGSDCSGGSAPDEPAQCPRTAPDNRSHCEGSAEALPAHCPRTASAEGLQLVDNQGMS